MSDSRDADTQPATDADLRLATWTARALDDYHLDPIIGFVLPGAGDAIGTLLGLIIVGVGLRRGVSRVVVARMLINLAVDGLIGAVPLLGDAYDLVHKANRRNLILLQERHRGTPAITDWLFLAAAALLFVTALAAPLVLFGWIIKRILQLN